MSRTRNTVPLTPPENTLLTVLPSSEAMQAVYLDPQTGVLAGASKHSGERKLLIECGTIAQSTISEVADASKEFDNVDFVDAPISGGPIGSKEGSLTFMVGCPKDMFASLKSLLVHMGKPESIFHCGDVGAGTACKIINNYISLISVVSVSEAYNIASKMNLDLNVLTDLFNTGSAQCWVTSKNNPVPGIQPNAAASKGYEGGFRIELAHKVLTLGKELAEMVGAETTLDKAALEVYTKVAADPRYAGKDARVVYKYLSENS